MYTLCIYHRYETKPALSVPIHVVELSNVPQELRMSAAVPPPQPSNKQGAIEGHKTKVKIKLRVSLVGQLFLDHFIKLISVCLINL